MVVVFYLIIIYYCSPTTTAHNRRKTLMMRRRKGCSLLSEEDKKEKEANERGRKKELRMMGRRRQCVVLPSGPSPPRPQLVRVARCNCRLQLPAIPIPPPSRAETSRREGAPPLRTASNTKAYCGHGRREGRAPSGRLRTSACNAIGAVPNNAAHLRAGEGASVVWSSTSERRVCAGAPPSRIGPGAGRP